MSSLRNAFTVTTNDGTRDLVNEELTANGMGDLRRNWNTGRIGTEANYLAAQELGLRKDGRNDEADAVRAQIEGLQQRQALYAPTVGRVEDIRGVGDAVDWVTGQVGQGAASMLDPMALAAGIGTAGRIAGMSKNPYARLFSKAAPYLAPMGAYGIGQRQLTGEMGNSMADDPTLMANTTADQRWQNANLYGGGAAMLDTFLPGHLAGKVVGKGAISALAKGGMREAGTELLGEGATEAAQEFGKQQVLGQLNPNRDTSGDASDLLNAGLGGFAGATGPVALGAGAQAVHNRVAKTRDALGGVAGDVTDLVTGATTQAQEKGKGLMDMALGLFGRGKGPQDLQEGAPEAQDGPPGPFRLSGEDKAALDPEEAGIGPDHPEYGDRILARADFVQQKLAEMAGTDPRAAEIYQRMTANPEDYGTKLDVADEGANFLMGKHTSNELNARGEAMQENVKTIGKAVGKAAASVVKGVAKGAATFGKAAWDGATSKKNAQATGPDQDRSELASSYAEDVAGKLHDGKRGVRVLARRVTEQIIEHMSMRSNDRMYSPQRNVDAHGLGNRDVVLNRLASTVKKIYGAQAQTVLDEVGKIMNGHGKKIVDYIKKEVETLSAPDGRTHERNRRAQLADTLLSMVPPKKEAALTSAGINIRDGADREKFLSLMEDFADGAGAPGLRNQLNAVFGPATVKQMVDHLNGVEIARGKDEKPAKESAVFAQSGHEGEELGEGFEVSEDGEITDYAKRQGDKQVSKRGAPKLYGFKNTQTTRNSSEWSNPLAGPRVSEAAMREWRDAVAEAKTLGTEAPEDPRIAAAAKRPSLFGKDDTLSDGRNAIEARIEHMVAKLGDRAASWSVTAKKASDVLDEMDASDEARISTYRDYLRKALGSQKGTVEQKAKWRAEVETLGRVLRDMRSGDLVDKGANVADRSDEDDETTSGVHSLRKKRLTAQAAAIRSATDPEAKEFSAKAYASTSPARPRTLSSPGERRKALDRAKNYLSNRYIVVAEDMTNRAPEDISVSEVETMSRAGMTAMDNARKITSMVESRIKSAKISGAEANQMRKAAQREYNEVVDAYNILEFAPVEDGGKPIYIKAGDLVYWARTQRGKSESSAEGASYSRNNLDREYLDDLMTGISTILASGLVGARLPTKRNKFGVEETFAEPKGDKKNALAAVPDSLRLVTKTAGQLNFRTTQKPSDPTVGTFDEEARHDEVAREQLRDNTSVPEMAGAERDAKPAGFPSEMPGFPSQEEVRKTRKTLRSRLESEGALDPREAIHVPGSDKKTGRDDVVPSELERQRDTDDFGHAVAEDEYTDAQFRNRIEGYDASTTVSAEFKLSAASKAKERGLAIRAKLIPGINEGGDELTAKQLEGINEIAARIRSAYRPERREKGDDGLVGGWHYLYPVAHALNTDSLRKMAGGKDPAGLMPTLKFLRDQFKRALLDSAATPSQKAAVLRAASPAEWANKITEDNVIQLLERDAPARDEGLLSSAESRTTGPSRQYDVGRKRIDPNDSPRRGSQPGFFGPEQPAPDFLPSSAYRGNQTPEVQREMSATKREASAPSDRAYSPQVKQREAERAANDRAARLDKMIVDEDYSKLTTKDRVDHFLRAAKDRYAELGRMEKQAELTPEQKKAYGALWEMFNPRSFTDLASFYDGIEGAENITDDQVRAMLNNEAASEVAAQAPKSQSAPAGAQSKRNDQVFPNDGPNRIASDEDMAKAKEYLAKVAPQIKLKFENITGYSGEFIEAENVIKISTTAAAGTMETAYHEALHAFFAKFIKSDPKVLAAMRTLAENEKLLARVHALLKGFPAAQRQLADGEERLAYIFQFWAAGKLDLPVGRPTTIMQKLRKFFRRVAGMITNEERAVDLMHAFHEGKLSEPSAAGRVIADIMNQGTLTPAQLRKMDGIVQKAMGMIAPAEEILARSESETARELAKEFFTNPGDEDSVGHEEGYINATRTISLKYTNKFASIVRNLTDRDMSDVVNHMVNKELEDDAEIAYAPVRDAVKSLRKLLREVYDHTKEAGVEMGEFKGSYFPRVWSVSKLTEGRDAFIKMLVDNYPERLSDMVSAVDKDGKKNMTAESIAAEIWQFLTTVTAQDGRNDVTRQDGVLAPFFASGENRNFAWIETKHSGDFQHKNLTNIVTGYIHQSVKAAEYTRRFGRSGKILEKKLKAVRAELHEVAASKLNAQEFGSKDEANKWVEERMKNINRACGAMEGTLGKDISPTLRKFSSWMMVYQNLRLLPLTLFASVVDPLGMVARGATMKEAYETFLRGMKEVFTNWADMVRENPKERVADKWEILAEHIGALDSILFSHHVAEEYSSTYLSPGAKKVNDALFKINGMESWNRGVRAGAVRSAVKFIERHSKLPEVHSERWMRELGLTPEHIALDPFGELILDAKELAAAKGISEPEAARRVEVLHSAINRWVLGAILTPNAAQRPAWASDPHYSIFFHLKQFSYSFHQTILKRAVKEMNHGNLAPIGAFAGYIPIMIASDVVKGLIVGGGELPNHMKGYDLGDWVKHGIERSGTLGIAGIGVDASQDIFSLAGPGVEQVADAMVDPLEQTTVRALPLSPMYAQLLK